MSAWIPLIDLILHFYILFYNHHIENYLTSAMQA